MILKNIWIISVVCVVLAQSFPAAEDACMPCNEQTLSSFLNCLTTKLYENGFLSRTSEADANDVNEGIVFAVTAFQSNKRKFNERVMLSILATEMCELLLKNGSITQSDVIARALSGFGRQCYIDVTGETNEKFSNEFEVLVNSMVQKALLRKNKLELNDASQSSAESSNFGGFNQNSNGLLEPTNYAYSNAETTNFESDSFNQQQNLPLRNPILTNQQNGVQNWIVSANTAENQYNYSPFTGQQIQSFPVSEDPTAAKPEVENLSNVPPNEDNAAIKSFSDTRVNGNQNSNNGATGDSNYLYRNDARPQQNTLQQHLISVQPASFNQVREESFNMKPSEQYPASTIYQENFPSDEQPIDNNRDGYKFPPAAMNQRQELIEGKDVYNVPEQMNSYSLEQYPDQKNQYQEASLAHNTDNSEIEKLTSNSSSTGQNSSTTLSKKQKKKHRNSQKNRGKAKKQKNKKPSSAKQVHGENERSMDYSTSYSNQQQGTSSEQNTYEPENGRKVETTNSEAYSAYSLPSTKAPSKNRSNSSTKTPSKNRSNSQKKDEKSKKQQNISTATPYQTVTNSDFASNDNISPKTQGFQGLSNRFYSKMKALELGKIIFVVLSKNELFSKTFNKDITNIDAQLLTFQIVSRGMKQCGYFNISDDIAQSCTQAICSVKEGSSSQVYSQALAKAIALYFHKNQLLQDDSENQAKDVALAMIQFLPDERKLYDYNAQDQKQPTSYANSPSEVNNYPFDTYTENSPSEDSKTNAENTNGMHAQNYNTKYTEMETETNGENIRSHSSEENYVNENNINDKEAVDYDESNDENDEQDQADKSYDQDNINTIRIGPTADETDYECDKTAESGEYNNLNDARGDSTESNEKGDYDDESNNENYDDADTNFKNSNTKIIAMADADVGTDYEFDETENDDYKYNDDRTQDDTPSNYDISTANESKTYGTSYKNDGIYERDNDSSNNRNTEFFSMNKQMATNKPLQKKNFKSKKNKRQNKNSTKSSSSTFQNRSENRSKTAEEKIDRKSGSENRIEQPRSAATEGVWGEKFEYESFLEELYALMEKANKAKSTWIEERQGNVELIEDIFYLIHLLLKDEGMQDN